MGSVSSAIRWPPRLGIGLAAGIAIAAVDNFAFEGEVSPIIIVALLLAAFTLVVAIVGTLSGMLFRGFRT
jgi:hypothetical protein